MNPPCGKRFPLTFASIVLTLCGLCVGQTHASVNLPLHHWVYDAIERLTALEIIDSAMVVAKPYSRKQAAKYVARAIERIRADEVNPDAPKALPDPLLHPLMKDFRPHLLDLALV